MAEAVGLGQVGGQARSAARFACMRAAGGATPPPDNAARCRPPPQGGRKATAKMRANISPRIPGTTTLAPARRHWILWVSTQALYRGVHRGVLYILCFTAAERSRGASLSLAAPKGHQMLIVGR
jgi:hypothetical protein